MILIILRWKINYPTIAITLLLTLQPPREWEELLSETTIIKAKQQTHKQIHTESCLHSRRALVVKTLIGEYGPWSLITHTSDDTFNGTKLEPAHAGISGGWVEQGPTGRDEQTALQVGASRWHQPGRALESVSCREHATGKSNNSLRNSTVQFTHGPPGIILKHFHTRVRKIGGDYKRGTTLFWAPISVTIPWVPEVLPASAPVARGPSQCCWLPRAKGIPGV